MGAQGISCASLPTAGRLFPPRPSFTWLRHMFTKQVHPMPPLHVTILRSVKGRLLATLLRVIPLERWNGYFISLPYSVKICNESQRVAASLPLQLRNLHELKRCSPRAALTTPATFATGRSAEGSLPSPSTPPGEQLLRLHRAHPEYCFLFLVSFQNPAVLEPSPDTEPFQALNSGLFTKGYEIIFSSFL